LQAELAKCEQDRLSSQEASTIALNMAREESEVLSKQLEEVQAKMPTEMDISQVETAAMAAAEAKYDVNHTPSM